jgi:ubiquinone/menaquinone biosynthesis C-methylase UbiE
MEVPMAPTDIPASDDPTQSRVAQHYARPDIERTILDALAAAGKDVDHLSPDDLSPVDEFHTGGRAATVEFARQIGVTSHMHLLDIGSGIGGPSRYFASTFGCRVTGIDLTEDYVRTAETLTRRVGLSERLAYRQASAQALPFESGSFDGAYMIHVGMNIEDKPATFAEVRRVLRPASVFAIFDVMRMGPGEIDFPVHWSTTAATSFLASPSGYRQALEAAGFEVLRARNRGDFAREVFGQAVARAEQGVAPPPLGTHLFIKDVRQKLTNVANALEDGLIAPVELIARAKA